MGLIHINANQEQMDALYNKHLKPVKAVTFLTRLFKKEPVFKSRIIFSKFSYDSEDKVGFYEGITVTGKTVQCQYFSNGKTGFIEVSGFPGNFVYRVNKHEGIQAIMDEVAKKASDRFWAGKEI